ncbi:Transient receptor potential cation channel subfamily M member 1 [Trichoplax sp. H2]|nr:Transient receptor potential cation channel subfamily M member 1 [Trichoplax sp. H2]|eukprot:RDD36726.1 Transient receptor potential cation channel subfamily M member 1 [Trichoplax sp. H2]
MSLRSLRKVTIDLEPIEVIQEKTPKDEFILENFTQYSETQPESRTDAFGEITFKLSNGSNSFCEYVKTSVNSNASDLVDMLKTFYSSEFKSSNLILSIIGGDIELQDSRSIVLLSEIAASIPPPHVDGLIVVTSGYYCGYTQYIASKIKERSKPLLGRKYKLIGMPTWDDLINKEILSVDENETPAKVEVDADKWEHMSRDTDCMTLDPRHDFHFCIDCDNENGDPWEPIRFRANFEKYLEESYTYRSGKSSQTIILPLAHLVVGGRYFHRELELISQVTQGRRSILVIFQGTGGIADLLAEAITLYDAGDRQLNKLRNKMRIEDITISLLLKCVRQCNERQVIIKICDASSMQQKGDEAMEFILSYKRERHATGVPEVKLGVFNKLRELKRAISNGDARVISSMIEIGMVSVECVLDNIFEFYKSGFIDPSLIELLLGKYRSQASKCMATGKLVKLQISAWNDFTDEGFRPCYKEIANITVMSELNYAYTNNEPFKHIFLWSCFRMDEKCSSAFMANLKYPVMAGFFAYRLWTIYIHQQQKRNKRLVDLDTWKDYAKKFLTISVETLDICQRHLSEDEMQSLLNQPLKGWNDLSVMSVLCKPCIFQNTPDPNDPILDVATHEWYSNALDHYWNYGVPIRALFRPSRLKKQGVESSVRFYLYLFKLLLSSPRIKFYLNFISYFSFLFLYSYFIILEFQGIGYNSTVGNHTIGHNNTNQRSLVSHLDSRPLEVTLLVWIILLTLEEFRQVLQLPAEKYRDKFKNWASDIWNQLDFAGFCMFFVACALHTAGINGSDDVLISTARILYCMDFLVLCPRSLQVLSVLPNQGPKLVMIFKLLGDMVSFLFILFVMLIAFGVTTQALLQPEVSPDNVNYIRDIFYITFYRLAGEVAQEQGNFKCAREGTPLGDDCWARKVLVNILMVVYILITVILLLNLLIAILSKSYDRLDEESIFLWRRQYNDIVAEYLTKPILVPPLNIIWLIFETFKVAIRLMSGKTAFKPIDLAYITNEIGTGVELNWKDVSTERCNKVTQCLLTANRKSQSDLDITERMDLLQQSMDATHIHMESKISVNANEIEMTRSRINDQILAVENSVISEMQKQNLDVCVLLKQLYYQLKSKRMQLLSNQEGSGEIEERNSLEFNEDELFQQLGDVMDRRKRKTTHI